MSTKQWTPPRNWRWMAGMADKHGNRLGCLLALVREAWDDPTAHVGHSTSMDYPGWTVWFHDGVGSVGPRDTEAEALLAALEAAP